MEVGQICALAIALAALVASPAAAQEFTPAACLVGDEALPPRPDAKPAVTNQTEVSAALERLYQPLAAKGVSGLANLCVFIDDAGEVKNVRLLTSTGNTDLDAVAIEVGRVFRFRPLTADGAPVQLWHVVPLTFKTG
jgi:TonB family protein